MNVATVGSVCSGIEAASVAWGPLGLHFEWFSEIADFPSRLLAEKYPDIVNLGDMNGISDKIHKNEINAPDLICGGTPCQAFSLAGWKNGLRDGRGNLTLKFVDIVEEIYISPVGCYGIIRRKQERNLQINKRLEEVLLNISSKMSPDEIEKRSRVQKRGKLST